MTEERAKKVLQEQIDRYGQEYDAEGIEALEMAIKALEQTMWIPCSERLPEKNGEYLITGRRGAVNKQRYHDGHWYSNWSVLAWMPLPESYKAETRQKVRKYDKKKSNRNARIHKIHR